MTAAILPGSRRRVARCSSKSVVAKFSPGASAEGAAGPSGRVVEAGSMAGTCEEPGRGAGEVLQGTPALAA